MRTIFQHSIDLVPWRLRHHIRKVPFVAPLQRWLINRFAPGEAFEHRINAGPACGLCMEIQLPGDKTLWTGTYEQEFAHALAKSVKEGDTCFDIGGFRGFMSGVLALAGAGQVITFEPLEENVAQLRRLISLNPQLRIEVQPIAVGNLNSEVKFEQMPEQSMGKISESGFQQDVRGTKTISVCMRSIDSLIATKEISPPSLIKIDVEGAELLVLSGAAVTLKTYKPIVFVEAHSPTLADQCIAFLRGNSYSVERLATHWAENNTSVCHLKAESFGGDGKKSR